MPNCTHLQNSLAWCMGTPELPGIRRRIYYIKVLLEADGAMFAAQDLEMAKILALPVEKPILDSIEAKISAART